MQSPITMIPKRRGRREEIAPGEPIVHSGFSHAASKKKRGLDYVVAVNAARRKAGDNRVYTYAQFHRDSEDLMLEKANY